MTMRMEDLHAAYWHILEVLIQYYLRDVARFKDDGSHDVVL